jgi:hypothetical protein
MDAFVKEAALSTWRCYGLQATLRCKTSFVTRPLINPQVLTSQEGVKRGKGVRRWNEEGCPKAQREAAMKGKYMSEAGLPEWWWNVLLPRKRAQVTFLSAITEWIVKDTCKCCIDVSLPFIQRHLTSLSPKCKVYNALARRCEQRCGVSYTVAYCLKAGLYESKRTSIATQHL